MKEYCGLTIIKGGKLIERYWNYDRKNKKGSYKEREIKKIYPQHLHDKTCRVGEGVTLKDLFKLMSKSIEYWHLLVGNWCDEFVKEGLQKSSKKESVMDYMELYWHPIKEVYPKSEEFMMHYRMDFHGKSIKKVRNLGQNYSIAFSKVNNYSHLPLKIDSEVYINNYLEKKAKYTLLGKQEPTLFQIVYSIIWEISYHGPPSKRDKETIKLVKRIEEAKKNIDKMVKIKLKD